MARALGLAEQHEKFDPTSGEIVMADIDVDQFTTNTLDLLNLVILIHAGNLDSGTIQKLMQYSMVISQFDFFFLGRRLRISRSSLFHSETKRLLSACNRLFSLTSNLYLPMKSSNTGSIILTSPVFRL
jgi:hypothetical protein